MRPVSRLYLGLPHEARQHLDEGIKLSTLTKSDRKRGVVLLNQISLDLDEGKLDQASVRLLQADRIATQ